MRRHFWELFSIIKHKPTWWILTYANCSIQYRTRAGTVIGPSVWASSRVRGRLRVSIIAYLVNVMLIKSVITLTWLIAIFCQIYLTKRQLLLETSFWFIQRSHTKDLVLTFLPIFFFLRKEVISLFAWQTINNI